MKKKWFIERILYSVRNLFLKKLFIVLEKYCQGDVLDVGGRDFYSIVKKKKINFKTWTVLEKEKVPQNKDCIFVRGDGCDMQFEDNRFDTVLNIQVLEHVFHPIKMVQEIARVLKPNGYGIFVIPQTAVTHEAPDHYYNFTRFWIKKVMEEVDLEILELKPLGGIWSSTASHLFLFFFQSIRFKRMSTPECKRNIFFYLLYPLMILYAVLSIPICILLSFGDLTEEPNNYLVITIKR